jgi:hypothetical protein
MSANHRTVVHFMAYAALAALAVACGTGWIVMARNPSEPLISLAAGGTAFCTVFFGSAGWAAVLKSGDNSARNQPQPPVAGQASPAANQPGTPVT